MDAIKVETQGERLVVQAPFHPDLPAKSRDLGGRWDARQTAWTFDVRDEAAVREMLVSIFGTDGSPVETTDVPVTLVEPTTKSPLADVDTNILIAELERRGYQVVQR